MEQNNQISQLEKEIKALNRKIDRLENKAYEYSKIIDEFYDFENCYSSSGTKELSELIIQKYGNCQNYKVAAMKYINAQKKRSFFTKSKTKEICDFYVYTSFLFGNSCLCIDPNCKFEKEVYPETEIEEEPESEAYRKCKELLGFH